MIRSYEQDFNLNKPINEFIKDVREKIYEIPAMSLNIKVGIFDTITKSPELKQQYLNKLLLHYIINDNNFTSNLKSKLIKHKTSKKYAIQLSGHMRNLSLEKWQKFVANNPDVDIFIHTWTGNGDRKLGSWVNETETRQIDINKIIDVFKPKKFLIENNSDYLEQFSVYNMDNTLKTYYEDRYIYFEETGDMSRYIVSQLYSIYTVNKLRNEYEKLKNINYDFVFRIRADNFVDLKIDELSTINNDDNMLYINSDSHQHPLLGRGCVACAYEYPNKSHKDHSNMICDIFYYGSPKIIDKVSSIYLNILPLLRDMEKYNEEQIKTGLYNHLLVPKKYPGMAVTMGIAEDLIFKCIYPERLIIEFMKDEFLITDPLRHNVIFK